MAARSKHRGEVRHQALLHAILIVACLVVLAPLFYLVVNSFKDNYEVILSPFALPSVPTIENYKKAWTTGGLAEAMLNTVLVVAVSTVVLAVVSCMMSYGMVFLGVRSTPIWSALLMLAMQVPLHMYIVPLFVMWKQLGLVNNPLGIILIESPRILVTSVVSKRRHVLLKNCQNSLQLLVPIQRCVILFWGWMNWHE